MLIGPVFAREAAIAPRRPRMYAARATYAAALLVLMFSAWLVLTGTQLVRDVGDLARFGAMLFQILAPLQLALAIFFAALLSASAVAQEKDRRTLVLLLLTQLTNSELVLGKLLAALLQVFVMLAAGLPVFSLVVLLGGVAPAQIVRVFAVTLASVLVCGSLGSTIALWREKTFQSLAMTILGIVAWLGFWEAVADGAFGTSVFNIECGTLAAGFSPWRAILVAARPYIAAEGALGVFGTPVYLFLTTSVVAALALNLFAIAMVRVWNPSRELQPAAPESDGREASIAQAQPAASNMAAGAAPDLATSASAVPTAQHAAADVAPAESAAAAQAIIAPGSGADPAARAAPRTNVHATDLKTRHVWDNPVLWREVRTWAYGRKILFIRFAFVALFAIGFWALHTAVVHDQLANYGNGALFVVPMFLLCLVMVNAQAVTAMTSERDIKALDLLLVTDLSPKEIVFGKLGGIFWNTLEMTLLPLALCFYLAYQGLTTVENAVYLVLGLATMFVFVAMLGLHAGMIYDNSRSAIATSLGTVFFLFVGVATCMRIMLAFSGSFQAQLLPFSALFLVGGVGLYLALGARNPSSAIAVASFLCPFATFYGITSYLLGDAELSVLLVTVAAYGFTTAAMMIPALYEFDVTTGKSTFDEQ